MNNTKAQMIKFIVTRDSVCAGDDIDAPHTEIYEHKGDIEKLDLVNLVSRKAIDTDFPENTWVCLWNGGIVAEFTRGSKVYKIECLIINDVNIVHFKNKLNNC